MPFRDGKASLPRAPVISVDDLYSLVRRAAPFATLTRSTFENVLDLLSGQYPSDEFAELRPRITWDRTTNLLTPREGAQTLAILNAGTIPDRGLYGVFLSGDHKKPIRVGELDEEMVFESRVGEVFILGASTWRIDDISHDRVLVTPAPGEPGKMPFWHGDQAGRPLEFGRRIGALIRELRALPPNAAISRLVREHDLDAQAAENLLQFLTDQANVTTTVPDDRNIVIERIRDELGDWRVCVLTPFGNRIHTPWAMAAAAQIADAGGPHVETMATDDGFVLRFPDTDAPPDPALLLPNPANAQFLVVRQLSSTALFAAKFREASARALLLPAPPPPNSRPALAAAQTRFRSARCRLSLSLLPHAPRSVSRMPARHLRHARPQRRSPLHQGTAKSRSTSSTPTRPRPSRHRCSSATSATSSTMATPLSPSAAPLLSPSISRSSPTFSAKPTSANSSTPSPSRKSKLTSSSSAKISALVPPMRSTTCCLRLGDLSRDEIAAARHDARIAQMHSTRSCAPAASFRSKSPASQRFIAVEDAARYRDALGIILPPGLPKSPHRSRRRARPRARPPLRPHPRPLYPPGSHSPLRPRRSTPSPPLSAQLVRDGRVLEGGFRPAGSHREFCDAESLRLIRDKSLARLRKEIEPADPRLFARLETHWQGVLQKRRGLDALLDTIESLQGAPLPASLLESQILPARLARYSPADLDTLIAAGEVVWCGFDSLGERDGRIALYLADRIAALLPPRPPGAEPLTPREQAILDALARSGATFFADLHEAIGSGFPGETIDALWSLVWRGLVTNDTLHALRAYIAKPATARSSKREHNQPSFRSRRTTPPSAQGRWTLVPAPDRTSPAAQTAWSHAIAQQLLHRYGIVTRETVAQENLPGGFSAVYEVLKALEAQGRIRRGYFIAGLGGAQFAQPAAVELLRSLSANPPAQSEMLLLAAADPANPWGSILRWPEPDSAAPDNAAVLNRGVGASVVLRNGDLVAWLRRNNPALKVILPADEPDRTAVARDLATFLANYAQELLQNPETRHSGGLLIDAIAGRPAHEHFLAAFLQEAGFHPSPKGFHVRYIPPEH